MAKPFAFETVDGNQRSEKRALCVVRTRIVICAPFCTCRMQPGNRQSEAPCERPFLLQNVDRDKQTGKRKEQGHPFLSHLAHSSSPLRHNYRGASVIL